MEKQVIRKSVQIWLWVGLVMIFFQVVIGGITRLTGSGLSITKWEIVTGAIPPLNEGQWIHEFELYKQTPQYQKINQGMSLVNFKWIFFWEYIHRLWARSMGFVFLIPFLIFWLRGYLSKSLKTDLVIVFLLAGIVGAFGWIMVASGLINRPWVNAYKLSLHLGLALLALCYLWWTILKIRLNRNEVHSAELYKISKLFLILVAVQIILGGMMSGMKAALMYPTFPMMGDHLIDPVIWSASSWKWIHFVDYDVYSFLPALVQLLHRSLAMVILSLWIISVVKWKESMLLWLGFILSVQILLGILTLLYSKGMIPVGLGVMHQGMGIILLLISVRWYFIHRNQA